MLNKTKKVILVFCLGLLSYTSFGQNNTNSPYSMFGIGDLFNNSYGRSASMGGVSTPLISIYHLNPSNPASYVSVMPGTFIFEVGLAANYYMLKEPDKSFTKFDANIRYLAIGFPVTKWWKSGIGLSPVSSIGYEIQQDFTILPDTTRTVNTYKGEGGVNSLYFDNSFQLLKSLSLGIKIAYLFGSLDRIRAVDSYNTSSTTFVNESNRAVFDAFSFGLGAHYHKLMNENLFLNVGATYNFNTDLSADYENLTTLTIAKSNGSFFIDTISSGILEQGAIQIPQRFAFGTSILFKQKLELAFDYQKDNWSDSKFFGENQNLSNNQRFSFGLEYTPDYGSPKYFKLIRYRAGFNYIKSYLMIEDTQIKQTGGTLGIGLPIKSGAFINFAVLYNHREAPGIDLLQENYFQFNLNVSFRANWFLKRHFD